MKSLIDILLNVSKERVRAQFLIGTRSVESLESYILGYSAAAMETGVRDFRSQAFFDWLRKRGDMPRLGWIAQMLKEANGDSKLAMDIFLDRVEKFVDEGG